MHKADKCTGGGGGAKRYYYYCSGLYSVIVYYVQ